MFKKQITYVDFNGTERKEDFYFHLSVPEVTRLEAKLGNMTIETYAMNLKANQDEEAMIRFIEDLVLLSFGRKSDDGKTFLKTPEIRTAFEYSQAYAELFEELFTVDGAAEKFANGIARKTKEITPSDFKQKQ